ncbi:siderophore iron transporter [Ascobolus immersus RN42]|uniref:Siderophore iron transporter n=1 Tax=Ascobolus immersus RN42 TaxID=1160509 RepID=A0A3N4HMK2_ASCIM|nr:siderophore iron transporter [Ascobolus immersus RN42]
MSNFQLFQRFKSQGLQQPVAEDERISDNEKSGEFEKQPVPQVNEKAAPAALKSEDPSSDLDNEEFTKGAQAGVRNMEAITSVWSRNHLIAAYIMIWIIYFVDAMQQSTSYTLAAYITSDFSSHSLLATTSVMSSLIGGLTKLPLAKVIDIWGRPHGYLLMVVVLTIGLIMMAACKDVETYAAAQVFYWVGYNGLTYVLGIFVADTSSLKNRGFMLAYIASPYIATAWIGGPLAASFLKTTGFRWAFGIWSIVTPVVTLPLFFLFWHNYQKAKKAGLIVHTPSGRTTMQSLKHYLIEFDVFGILLLLAGFSLFLLSFNIYGKQPLGWKSPMIICFLVFGVLLLVGFVVFERYFAPVTFIPYELLLDRSVVGACILAATLFVSFYIWNSYFYSFNIVVMNQSITNASYIGNIYTIGSCFASLIVGLLIRWSGRIKWIALYFGVPVTILGVGLMMQFRQPGENIGYVVMCQIFIAFSGGACVITEQMIAMAATTHQYVAVVLAVEGMFSSVGGAIGSTIAAAVWQHVFPQKLREYLPESAQANVTDIAGSMIIQTSYAIGTPERDAINRAYGDAQRDMLIAATAVLAIGMAGVIAWRDIKVKNFKQVKGTVF